MDEENKNTTPTSEENTKTNETEVKEVAKAEVKEEPKADPKPEETNAETQKQDAPKTEAKKEEPKQEPKQEAKTEAKAQKPKKKKKVGLIVSIIVIVLAIIAGAVGGAVYALVLAKTEIDLAKYVTFEFSGYEGYASFDEEDLVIDTKGLKKVLESKKLAEKLSDKLMDKVTVKENKEVKNGDEIEVKFKVSESWLKENKIKLASNSIKIKVKDLEEPNSVDLFKDLEFTYSGISPDLSVSLKNNSSDNFIKNKVSFSMEKEGSESSSYSLYDVANGDKITVSATYSQDDLEAAGYVVAKDEYTFTVEGQAEYISDAKLFTDDVKSKVEPKLLERAKSIANYSDYDVSYAYHEDFSDASYYDWNFTHSDPELVKMYIAVNKDMENMSWSDSRNTVFAIYKSTFTDTKTSKTYDFYIPVCVEDLVTNSDGLYSGKSYYYEEYYNSNYNDTDYKTSESAYKVFDDSMNNNYTITEIK